MGAGGCGDGSRLRPVATLSKAFSLARASGRRVCECATRGAFTEALTIDAKVDGVAHLVGSIAPTGRIRVLLQPEAGVALKISRAATAARQVEAVAEAAVLGTAGAEAKVQAPALPSRRSARASPSTDVRSPRSREVRVVAVVLDSRAEKADPAATVASTASPVTSPVREATAASGVTAATVAEAPEDLPSESQVSERHRARPIRQYRLPLLRPPEGPTEAVPRRAAVRAHPDLSRTRTTFEARAPRFLFD
jgi:hypothetical protein